jgi:hypothetical protein
MFATTVAVEPKVPIVRSGMGWAALLATGVAILLICYAGGYGYMADELYFLACSEHPAWGYADLPPMLPWLTWLTVHTLGSSLYAIRLYPALAMGATVVLTALLARELGGRRRAVITAAVLAAVTPVLYGFGHILSTNALDMPLWAAAVLLLAKIENSGNQRLWIAFGAVTGVALLNKYTLAFFLVALMVGTLLTPWRRYLVSRWFWMGVGVALLIVLPNFVWQAQRAFPFLQLQINNRINHHNVILPPLQFFMAQAYLANPFSYLFVLAGAALFFTPAMRRLRALGWTFVAFVALMFALHARDYYLAAIYPTMFAAGAVAAERWLPEGWPWRGAVAYLMLAALLCVFSIPMMLPILPPAGLADYIRNSPWHRTEPENMPHTVLPDYIADQLGWREPVEMVARYYNALPPEERAKTAIMGNYYGQAGAIDHYGPALGLPRAIGGHHSYWFWGSRGYTGESVILMDAWPGTLRHCASVTVVGEIVAPWSRPDEHPVIYHCRGLDYNLTQQWKRFRHFD